MGLTGGRVREGLVALPAREGLLSGVDTDVPFEVPGVGELLPTVLGREGQALSPHCPVAPRDAAQGPGWPHLTLVRDRAVGLGLSAVAVGARVHQAWLPRVLLPRICAS